MNINQSELDKLSFADINQMINVLSDGDRLSVLLSERLKRIKLVFPEPELITSKEPTK